MYGLVGLALRVKRWGVRRLPTSGLPSKQGYFRATFGEFDWTFTIDLTSPLQGGDV